MIKRIHELMSVGAGLKDRLIVTTQVARFTVHGSRLVALHSSYFLR